MNHDPYLCSNCGKELTKEDYLEHPEGWNDPICAKCLKEEKMQNQDCSICTAKREVHGQTENEPEK